MTRRIVPSTTKPKASSAENCKLKDVLIGRRSANRYNKVVWILIGTFVFGLGCIADHIDSLDVQCSWYLEVLCAEGESKSVANTTPAAFQHVFNRRRMLTGVCRLFAAWNRQEQEFQC